jgi:hypothetical protein
MSHFDYEASKTVELYDLPFYAIIMAAMRRADTNNAALLAAAFPETWRELQDRYHAPDGLLPSEQAVTP